MAIIPMRSCLAFTVMKMKDPRSLSVNAETGVLSQPAEMPAAECQPRKPSNDSNLVAGVLEGISPHSALDAYLPMRHIPVLTVPTERADKPTGSFRTSSQTL